MTRPTRLLAGPSAWISAALVLCAGPAMADPTARSGNYDGLTLAVVGDVVSGAFVEQRGMGGPGGAPQFSCIFLLKGRRAGARAVVQTWFPGDRDTMSGELVFTRDGARLTLAEDHGGCPMTTGSMVGTPYAVTRGAGIARDWLGVALVSAKRAVFRSGPAKPAARAAYVVRFDPVVILERREGWALVAYQGATKPVTGWLPDSELAIAAP